MAHHVVHFDYDHGPGGDYELGMIEFCEELRKKGIDDARIYDNGNGGTVEWDD